MADTIKAVIEELTNPLVHVQTGFYLPDHKVDQALAEIKRILEEAKPEYKLHIPECDERQPRLGYCMCRPGANNDAIDQYHTNLLKALGE